MGQSCPGPPPGLDILALLPDPVAQATGEDHTDELDKGHTHGYA